MPVVCLLTPALLATVMPSVLMALSNAQVTSWRHCSRTSLCGFTFMTIVLVTAGSGA